MSPAVKDRNERTFKRLDMENKMFRRQCKVDVRCTDRKKCVVHIKVPQKVLIHNLSVQVREYVSSKTERCSPQKVHNVVNKWRFVSNSSKTYERNLFHLGSEHVHLVGSVDKLHNLECRSIYTNPFEIKSLTIDGQYEYTSTTSINDVIINI